MRMTSMARSSSAKASSSSCATRRAVPVIEPTRILIARAMLAAVKGFELYYTSAIPHCNKIHMTMTRVAFTARNDTGPGRAPDLAYLAAVGARVRGIRARRGMSRKILARDSGVSERYLASLEAGHGNVSILLLKQIAQAMSVEVEELARSGPETPPEIALLGQWLTRLPPSVARRTCERLRRELGAAPASRKQRIALVGLRGAGKTTLGSRLAARRRVPFVELDREIERAAGAPLA